MLHVHVGPWNSCGRLMKWTVARALRLLLLHLYVVTLSCSSVTYSYRLLYVPSFNYQCYLSSVIRSTSTQEAYHITSIHLVHYNAMHAEWLKAAVKFIACLQINSSLVRFCKVATHGSDQTTSAWTATQNNYDPQDYIPWAYAFTRKSWEAEAWNASREATTNHPETTSPGCKETTDCHEDNAEKTAMNCLLSTEVRALFKAKATQRRLDS